MRDGMSTPAAHREQPQTMVSTGSCFAVRFWPKPTGSVIGGNHGSNWATSPATYAVLDAGSGGR